MTCFEIMKVVIDETAKAIFGRTELTEEEGKAVRGYLDAMSKTFMAGGAPDYAERICRFAYVYCYPAAHAHLFEAACDSSAEVRQLVRSKVKKGEPLRVCLLGAGPGTELVGLGKFLSRRVAMEDERLEVDALLVDREIEWAENIAITTNCVVVALAAAGYDIDISTRFEHFDFSADPANLTGRDLYAFNFAISEDPQSRASLQKLIAALTESMPDGASIVITDREQKTLVAFATDLLASAGLEITAQRAGVRNLELAEDCNEIKNAYYDRIQWPPRVQFGKAGMDQGAFWLVGTKKGQE